MLDESGFMLQPTRRRTWALRGHTPVHPVSQRHDRLSVLSAVSVSPVRRQMGLYFTIYRHNVTFAEIMAFVRDLHRHLRQPIVLVMDRLGAHRKAARLLAEQDTPWLEVEWLPAYAPELNPVEYVWNHVKYAQLANYLPEDIHELEQEVEGCLGAHRSQQRLLQSHFRHAKLSLEIPP